MTTCDAARLEEIRRLYHFVAATLPDDLRHCRHDGRKYFHWTEVWVAGSVLALARDSATAKLIIDGKGALGWLLGLVDDLMGMVGDLREESSAYARGRADVEAILAAEDLEIINGKLCVMARAFGPGSAADIVGRRETP